ncbi:inositol monophosphatase [Nocardioides panacisoli]|uniref:inositol monophosphatase family protein n=1 Tax=Nocardioides panacisoli TaxID=627624 RepID=UPI001C6328D2|nr:inositol monophosphatase family protein [Nocardioides panacisoli]QYJ04810.1 inositol monophosphatase [Nocardioides panacisoli]
MAEPDAAALAALALDVAREAADLVQDHAGRVGVAATKSSDVDVVTAADQAAEELIRARLAAARPDDAFLGEEGDDVPGTSGVRWIIDPIDGTVNFLYGLEEYAVSIAGEVHGEVVAGVVLNAASGVAYVGHVDAALAGGGSATRDGVALRVREEVPLAQRLVATGFGYRREVREQQAATTARLLPEVRDIRRHGSCALELCHLAEGALDAYVEEGVNLWDHAAGALIARLAGARTELLPGAGGRDLLVAAPENGYTTFLDAVRSAGFVRE